MNIKIENWVMRNKLPLTPREKHMIKWFVKLELSIILVIAMWVVPFFASIKHYENYQELIKQVQSIQIREANASVEVKDKEDAVADRAGDVDEEHRGQDGSMDSITAEEEYYKLIETNEVFRTYIGNMDVSRNNPGNLRFASQPGAVHYSGFASWDNIWSGFRALIKQIELDQSRNLSLEAFYNKFAPPSDNNDTESLIYEAEKLFNVTRKINIKELDTIRLAQYITFREHSVAIVNY